MKLPEKGNVRKKILTRKVFIGNVVELRWKKKEGAPRKPSLLKAMLIGRGKGQPWQRLPQRNKYINGGA